MGSVVCSYFENSDCFPGRVNSICDYLEPGESCLIL